MKRKLSKMISLALAMALSFPPVLPIQENGVVIISEAHQGRTDSNGGHHDYKNKSGLGDYHYHCGGYPAHLHTNGVCPYASQSTGEASVVNDIQETKAVKQVEATGWQQDNFGWWYKDSDSTFKKDGKFFIEGNYYLFNSDGYMMTGWQEMNGDWYYFDESGHMVTGYYLIDGEEYSFASDGKWNE